MGFFLNFGCVALLNSGHFLVPSLYLLHLVIKSPDGAFPLIQLFHQFQVDRFPKRVDSERCLAGQLHVSVPLEPDLVPGQFIDWFVYFVLLSQVDFVTHHHQLYVGGAVAHGLANPVVHLVARPRLGHVVHHNHDVSI